MLNVQMYGETKQDDFVWSIGDEAPATVVIYCVSFYERTSDHSGVLRHEHFTSVSRAEHYLDEIEKSDWVEAANIRMITVDNRNK